MHQLLTHPLFEEHEPWEILEPFGFESHVHSAELPDEVENPDEFAQFAKDAKAYIKKLEHTPPTGFIEIARYETEDADIVFVSVRAKTVFAQALLCADRDYASQYNLDNNPFSAIHEERMRQLSAEGFTRDHDDLWNEGELALAAAAYAISAAPADAIREDDYLIDTMEAIWPWDPTWFKPITPRRDLEKAGALILAEIERLDRAAAKAKAEEDAA